MNLVLHPDTATTFGNNGIGVLTDAITSKVVRELNGQYELMLKYPETGLHAEFITDRHIIMAKPDPVTDLQPFRIYRVNPVSKGTITAYARHIAYDTIGIPCAPFSASSCADAVNGLSANAVTDCPFVFSTDKNVDGSLDVDVPKSIWSIMGGSAGSILDRYGGEYDFDGYNIALYTRVGTDRGVSIRYGKNLSTLEQDRNCANVYTGVFPYWKSYEGDVVMLPERIVNAGGTYNFVRILPLDLSEKFEVAPTEEQLREAAEKYMVNNNIGVPDISWTVQFVQLEQTEEYKGMALLERVLLGDTVSVVFPRMNVNASARAVKIDFDPILERYNSVTLGKVKTNLATTIVKQQQEISKKPDETVMNAIVANLRDSITGAKGGAIRLLDTNGDGMPDELYIGDNPDPALAVKVWRWNYEGWAASKTGYDGPFVMGATLDNGILANAVTAANLVAGTIQSKDGKSFFLDLDNGILKMQAFTDLEEELGDIRNTIVEKNTSVLNDCESIIMTALENYVETGDYETFKKDVEAELKVVSNKITMDFTTLTERITTVEGDAQSKLAEIYKHIQFDDDGITIGSSENAITMNLDNDQLVFSKNGVEIVRLDIDNFTPTNVYVKAGGRLRLGDFAWKVLDNGVPVFMKVGG